MYCLMRAEVIGGVHTFTPFRYSDNLEYLREVKSHISHDDFVIVKIGEIIDACC